MTDGDVIIIEESSQTKADVITTDWVDRVQNFSENIMP